MKPQQIIDLITAWAGYAEQYPDLEVSEFCQLYLDDHRQDKLPAEQQNAEMSRLLGRLIKFVSQYGKKALEGEALQNFDDMLYIGVTIFRQEPRKSDVIQEMMSSFPTGTEIIKRLIRKGLLEEYADPQDGRSKRLKATSAGAALWFQFLPKLNKIGQMAFDYLTPAEKNILHRILIKLERFHQEQDKRVAQADFTETFAVLSAQMTANRSSGK